MAFCERDTLAHKFPKCRLLINFENPCATRKRGKEKEIKEEK